MIVHRLAGAPYDDFLQKHIMSILLGSAMYAKFGYVPAWPATEYIVETAKLPSIAPDVQSSLAVKIRTRLSRELALAWKGMLENLYKTYSLGSIQ